MHYVTSLILLQQFSHHPLWCIKQICLPSGSQPAKLFIGSSVLHAVGSCTAVNSHLVVLNNTDFEILIGQHPCGEGRQYCKYSGNLLQEQAQLHGGNALSAVRKCQCCCKTFTKRHSNGLMFLKT